MNKSFQCWYCPLIRTEGLLLVIPTDTVDGDDDMVPDNLRVTHNLEQLGSDTNFWNECVSTRTSELILGSGIIKQN